MKDEMGQRVVLSIQWKGTKDTAGGEADLDFSDLTKFEVKGAGDIRIDAKALPMRRNSLEQMRLDHLELAILARDGKVPTFPVDFDSQSVAVCNQLIRLTDGLVAPGERLTLGVQSCIPCLVVGFEVLEECASSFDLEAITLARMNMLGSSRVPAGLFASDFKSRTPIEPIYIGGAVPMYVSYVNKSDRPARLRGAFHCVDVTARSEELAMARKA